MPILHNQRGIVSPPIIILGVLIVIAGVVLLRNIPLGEPQPTPDKGAQGVLKMPELSSPSATPSATPSGKKVAATATPKASASPTATPGSNSNNSTHDNNSNNNNSNSNSNNNNQQSSNSTPNPIFQPSPTPEGTVKDFGSNGMNVSTNCNPNLQLYITTNHITPPSDRNLGVWMAIEDKSTGQNMIYGFSGNTYPNAPSINANIPPTGPIRGSGITISNDGREYTVRAYAGAYTNSYPTFASTIAEVTFSRKCQ